MSCSLISFAVAARISFLDPVFPVRFCGVSSGMSSLVSSGATDCFRATGCFFLRKSPAIQEMIGIVYQNGSIIRARARMEVFLSIRSSLYGRSLFPVNMLKLFPSGLLFSSKFRTGRKFAVKSVWSTGENSCTHL